MAKHEPDKVLRFTKGERFSHWVHAISFLVLLITGLAIMLIGFRPITEIFGGIQVSRYIHRIFGVVFVVVVVAMFFIGDTRNHWYWLKSVFKFTRTDLEHIKAFPKEFFGGHGDYPPQGKYNGGEKINSLITIFGSFFIALSGFIMWFPQYFPPALVRWAYPIHDLSMFVMLASFIGHFYLGVLHPESRAALSGMINGYVSSKFAKAHHGQWYKEITENAEKKGEKA